jgi:pyruvate/2-oxoglutarate/acetoin dehydrogenase E1 component
MMGLFDYLNNEVVRICVADSLVSFAAIVQEYITPDENKIFESRKKIINNR